MSCLRGTTTGDHSQPLLRMDGETLVAIEAVRLQPGRAGGTDKHQALTLLGKPLWFYLDFVLHLNARCCIEGAISRLPGLYRPLLGEAGPPLTGWGIVNLLSGCPDHIVVFC